VTRHRRGERRSRRLRGSRSSSDYTFELGALLVCPECAQMESLDSWGPAWMAAAWDQNSASGVSSPAAAVCEEVVASGLVDLLALPTGSGVGLVTGGQMANTTCLAVARRTVLRKAGYDPDRDGLASCPPVDDACRHRPVRPRHPCRPPRGTHLMTVVRAAAKPCHSPLEVTRSSRPTSPYAGQSVRVGGT
jgi:hypothetical protein